MPAADTVDHPPPPIQDKLSDARDVGIGLTYGLIEWPRLILQLLT